MNDSTDPLVIAKQRYWKANLIVIGILLTIWFLASCCCGILFIEPLNQFSIGNLPLGFWMANQGSMIVFVALILVYAVVMDLVDRRYYATVVKLKGSKHDN